MQRWEHYVSFISWLDGWINEVRQLRHREPRLYRQPCQHDHAVHEVLGHVKPNNVHYHGEFKTVDGDFVKSAIWAVRHWGWKILDISLDECFVCYVYDKVGHVFIFDKVGHIWAPAWQNQQYGLSVQRHDLYAQRRLIWAVTNLRSFGTAHSDRTPVRLSVDFSFKLWERTYCLFYCQIKSS